MAELETQVAKIEIWDPKTSNAHVFLLAQNALNGAELYVLCELPLLNPAASEDTKRIALAIGASLKRSYRRSLTENSFESALADINEELGKLAGLGQTTWVGKLNSVVAVKTGNAFSITSSGKMTALLLRDEELNAIIEPGSSKNPLKTYENFSVGKLVLGDKVVLSTNQILNYLSLDRLKKIMEQKSVPDAAAEVMEILQDQAGPEVAFGTLLLELQPLGAPHAAAPLAVTQTKTASAGGAKFAHLAGTKVVPVLKTIPGHAKKIWQRTSALVKQRPNIAEGSKQAWNTVASSARKTFSWSRVKNLSTVKKFFLISLLLLLLAFAVNISLTAHYKQTKAQQTQVASLKTDIQKLLRDADAAIIFRDEAKARELLSEAKDKIAAANLTEAQKKDLGTLTTQIADVEAKLEHRVVVQPTLLGTLSNAEHLISTPEFIATQSGSTITSYDIATGKISDATIKSPDTIVSAAFIKPGVAAIYTGSELKLWDYKAGTTTAGFSQNVPQGNKGVGLVFYTNNRVYTADTQNNQVVNFLVAAKNFSKPIVAITNAGNLSETTGMAIDGSVYLYNGNTVVKYSSGKLSDFTLPILAQPLGSGGKIYTAKDVNTVYVLDPKNKRILLLDKKGNLVHMLTSDQFTNLKDFVVDEKNKTIFVLNDNTLLKFSF